MFYWMFGAYIIGLVKGLISEDLGTPLSLPNLALSMIAVGAVIALSNKVEKHFKIKK